MSEPAERDKIIVFRHFETPIDANLAKTKLNAYGIPCFLTEENIATLYTGQSFQIFAVRLHLFSKDAELAADILNTRLVTEPDVCPLCKSENVTIEYSRNFFSVLATVLSGLFASLLPNKKVFRCQDCGHEF
jgi:hypothetical protein